MEKISYTNYSKHKEKTHKQAFDNNPIYALVIPINSKSINCSLTNLNDDILKQLKVNKIDPFQKWWAQNSETYYLRNTFTIPIAYFDLDNNFSASSKQIMDSYMEDIEGVTLTLSKVRTSDNSKITAVFKPENLEAATNFLKHVTRKLHQTSGITNIVENNAFETVIHYSEPYMKKSNYFYEDKIEEKSFTFNELLTIERKSCNELLNEMRYKSENFISQDENVAMNIDACNYKYYIARLSQPVMYQIIHKFKLKNFS